MKMDSSGLISSLGIINTISLLAVVAIGLPHGAMDGAVALALGYGRNRMRMAGFILGYVALAALVVVFWLAFPVLALMLFLLISLVHFGNGDTEVDNIFFRWMQIICHGGIVVVGIPLFHPAMTHELFTYLSGPDVGMLTPFLEGLAVLMTGAGVAYALAAIRVPSLRLPFVEFSGLLLAMWALPPIAGFAVYFACVHTPRHVRRIFFRLRDHNPELSPFRLTVIFTLLTWMGGGIAYTILAARTTADAAAFQVVFIGLAALTVPHMILIDGIFRPRMKN
jgi:Brp/Blh family beta-carotene 15,15'-monooxygenase